MWPHSPQVTQSCSSTKSKPTGFSTSLGVCSKTALTAVVKQWDIKLSASQTHICWLQQGTTGKWFGPNHEAVCCCPCVCFVTSYLDCSFAATSQLAKTFTETFYKQNIVHRLVLLVKCGATTQINKTIRRWTLILASMLTPFHNTSVILRKLISQCT